MRNFLSKLHNIWASQATLFAERHSTQPLADSIVSRIVILLIPVALPSQLTCYNILTRKSIIYVALPNHSHCKKPF